MKISSRGPLAAALLALLLAGCGMQPSMTQRQPADDPEQLLQEANQQAPAEAARSRLEAADILARQGRAPQALEIVKNLDDAQLSVEQRRRWALLLSELGESQSDPHAVVQAGQLLKSDTPPRQQANLLLERLGRALGELDKPLPAAAALLRLQAANDSEDLNDPIWAQLSRLPAGSLSKLRSSQEADTRAWLTLTDLVRDGSGDIERLFQQIDNWRDQHPDHPAARRLPSKILALRDLRGREIHHIAVFLPESGPLANVAEAIEQGMRAHHLNEVNSGASGTQLSFIDSSGGNLDELYREARNRGAQAVIGPLDKELVSRLEQREQVPLPTLALNYGTADHNQAENLFQYGLSAENEARQVARRGRVDGLRSAAVMVPGNDWGRRVGEAFRDTWLANGGEITRTERYNPGQPATESTRQAVGSPKPDMLFLLALPEYARQVPPTLDYYSASELPVYATSHLYEGRPQPRLDKDLDGVRFIDIPWQIPDAAVGGEDALPFLDSYHQLRQESEPSLFRLMAMGVDAYELTRRLPQFQAIPGSELFGATGTLSVGEDGRIQRQLPWARFSDGVPQPMIVGPLGDALR
ncbi:ABC transporter substrate-binding protein [Halomonas eurihalina]|uniref:ABC transporter substrate-binding protein n=1 Tax=Halomonas eurihalina TaxID=42566 RepID=A0A5D9CW47_HALER|nr:penicillin-binding protein activator [Halomonas eurihalina]MDR5859594.1 penicillin-binding protein activator [Halomonas eurihalina]TZG35302.1 ABC transporter substrate-binding protein [Halomonas eurihalina]